MRVGILSVVVTLGVAGSFATPGRSSPDPPSNPVPADGAGSIPADPLLCATVSDSGGEPVTATFLGRGLAATPAEDFTVIVLPDSRYYALNFPDVFASQTEFVVDNRKSLNIVFVTHVGNVVQIAANDYEWVNASGAMGLLEDPVTTMLPEGIPYGISVGNHDQDPSNRAGTPADPDATTAAYNANFGLPRFAGRSWFGGSMNPEDNDNHYEFFRGGGMDFIIVHNEFDDTFQTMLPDVLAWDDAVLQAHPDHRAFLTADSLLCTGSYCQPGLLEAEWSNQGQATYDALKHHPNLDLMFCGHAGVSTEQPRRSDVFDGNTIHTMLSHYQRDQDCPIDCGNGWLRILTFSPADDEITVTTYSPWLDQVWSGENPDHHNFTLPYDMDGGIPFAEVGSVTVQSGMSACVPWPGLQASEAYEWTVVAESAGGKTTGPRWSFTGDGACDFPFQCEDGDACTDDECAGGVCHRDAVPGCCHDDGDCDDGNQCTTDTCAAGSCSNVDRTGPCHDGDPCTTGDSCSAGACAGTAVACDDGNECTSDACVDGSCLAVYAPVSGCCATADHCDDGLPCTVDDCSMDGSCANDPDPSCCLDDAFCDDGNACTRNVCALPNRAALRLDGVDDHMAGGSVSTLGTERFTVECWFRWDGTGEATSTDGWPGDNSDVGGIDAIPLVAKGQFDREDVASRTVNYFLGIVDGSNVLGADFEEDPTSGPDPGRNHPVVGTTPVAPGAWHHAAVTYDGTCLRLFLDGQPEGTRCPAVTPGWQSQHRFAVGTTMNTPGEVHGRFGGWIDEVRVWGRALDVQEIRDHMFHAVPAHPDLLGRWGFDDVDGVVVPDTSGNGNPGVIHVGVFAEPVLETDDIVPLGTSACEVVTLPAETVGLRVSGGLPTLLSWVDQGAGTTYDVVVGHLPELRAFGGTDQAQCLGQDGPDAFLVDPRPDPGAGEGDYYLVRPRTGACGAGSYGSDSSGAERLAPAACP